MKDSLKQKLDLLSQSILTLAGIFTSPAKGTRSAGYSRMGAEVFTQDTLANNSDLNAGAAMLHIFASMVRPFNVLSKKEKEAMDRMEKESANPRLIAVLDKAHNDRKGETFIATLLKATDTKTTSALGIVAGAKIYDHWGVMSPAQKAISIAMLAMRTHKTEGNGVICDLKIIEGKDQLFRVSDALDLFLEGKNPYPLVEYWDQIYDLLKVYGGKPDPQIMADFATSHKFIGISIQGSAVPGVSKDAILKNGGKPAPQYGVGAIAIPKGKTPPNGYSKTAELEGGDLVSPKANIASAAGAISGSLIGSKAGASGISSDAVGVYKKWKPEDKSQADRGMDGGSQLIAGLSNLKGTNPYLYGAMVAFLTHFTHDKIGTSSPTEYAVSLAGIALSRLVTGRKEVSAEREGVALGRKIHDSTPAEFAKIQTNLKALYSNFGVSSKADAYQLSNQAYAEARINESDLVAMHEVFDIIYDSYGLATAQKLMVGKDKGLEIARSKEPLAHNTMTVNLKEAHKITLEQMTKEELRKKNAARNVKRSAIAEEQGETPSQDTPQEEETEMAPQQMGVGP